MKYSLSCIKSFFDNHISVHITKWRLISVFCFSVLFYLNFFVGADSFSFPMSLPGYYQFNLENISKRSLENYQLYDDFKNGFMKRTLNNKREKFELAMDIVKLNDARLRYLSFMDSTVPLIIGMYKPLNNSSILSSLAKKHPELNKNFLAINEEINKSIPVMVQCRNELIKNNEAIENRLNGKEDNDGSGDVALMGSLLNTISKSGKESDYRCDSAILSFSDNLNRLVRIYPEIEDVAYDVERSKKIIFNIIHFILVMVMIISVNKSNLKFLEYVSKQLGG